MYTSFRDENKEEPLELKGTLNGHNPVHPACCVTVLLLPDEDQPRTVCAANRRNITYTVYGCWR